jgi:hypothetical protein
MSANPGAMSPLNTLSGPAPIQGGLSVGNAGGNLFQGAGQIVTNPAQALNTFGGNYAGAYNSALSANMANYQNVLQGYQQTMGQQAGAQGAIQSGYGQLYNSVLGGLGMGQGGAVGAGGAVSGGAGVGTPGTGNWGIAAPAAQAIADQYAQQSGSATQGLVNSGLGNSTVLANVQRGVGLDAAKAYGSLGANLAQTGVGYMANLGQAGLNYQNQASQQNTALASQQLGFMGGTNIPYPSASAYGSLISGALGRYGASSVGGPQAVVNPFGSASGLTGGGGANSPTRPFPSAYPSGGSSGLPQTGGAAPGTGSPFIPGSANPAGGQYGAQPNPSNINSASYDPYKDPNSALYGNYGETGAANAFGTVGGGTGLPSQQATQFAQQQGNVLADLNPASYGAQMDAQGNSIMSNGDVYDQSGNLIGGYDASGAYTSYAGATGGGAGDFSAG